MKRIVQALAILVIIGLAASMLVAEGQKEGDQKVVGIAMPTQSSQRWIQDGGNMKDILEEKLQS